MGAARKPASHRAPRAATARSRAAWLPLAALSDNAKTVRHALGISEPPQARSPHVGGEGTCCVPEHTGAVHAKLAEFALSGALPLQEQQPDIPSAGFHLLCAAAANDARALRDLRSLCLGLSASEVLPGLRLVPQDVAAVAKHLPCVQAKLAAAGDLGSLVEMAQAAAEK
eukprot:5675208-Prymnesium_polylepis.1